MLNNKKFAVIGGDERYIQVIRYLADKNAQLFTYGFSEVSFEHPNIFHHPLEKIKFEILDGIILPILGMDDKNQIQLDYPQEKVTLNEDLINKTPEHCIIYTGTASDHLKNVISSAGRELVILFERDDIAIANSVPTAEATLQIAMEETPFTIHGSTVLITGFGRVGVTMARLFHQVGANVFVAARKQADFARIREMQMTPIPINHLNEVMRDINICINTVPHLIITSELIKALKKDSLIIDVASKPGGVDFQAAENKKIKTIHALGLPGRVAPQTAGNIIGQTIGELAAIN